MPDKRSGHPGGAGREGQFSLERVDCSPPERQAGRSNSADDVLGEVGLIMVIALGAVLAINMLLVGFHIS